MAFTVPKSKKSIKQNQFEFTLPDDNGKVHSIPLMKMLPPAFIASGMSNDLEFARRLFEKYDPGVFELFEDSEQLEEFMKAWTDASGVTAGESAASPT